MSPVVAKEGNSATPRKYKVALALGGGGARGAAHIGVLKVLTSEGIKPDLVVGNSMGAIIGGLFSAGVKLEDIEKMVCTGELQRAYAPRAVPLQLALKICGSILFWRKPTYPGLYSGEALEEYIASLLPDKEMEIEKTPIPFASIVTDLSNGSAYRITSGRLARAIRASASLPPAIKPLEVDDHVFADGAIRANLPTYPAKEMGAEIVIAVDVDEKVRKVDNDSLKSIAGLTNRVASIALSVIDKYHLLKADFVIDPAVDGINVLSSDPEEMRVAIDAGVKAARESLPRLKQFLKSAGVDVAGEISEDGDSDEGDVGEDSSEKDDSDSDESGELDAD